MGAGSKDWLKPMVGEHEFSVNDKLAESSHGIPRAFGDPHEKVGELIVGHENLNHPDAERIHVIANVSSMCCYSKATRRYQMKLGRVNLTVTLVRNPNDWTSSRTLVTFMGPYLAVY